MNRQGRSQRVLLVLVLALTLRVSAAAYWQRQADSEGRLFRLGDSHSYWTLATEFIRGRPYQYGSPNASVFRAPVYPILLAPFTLIEDQRTAVWAARLCGCALGTLAVGLVMVLANQLAGPRAVVPAGLLAAIYPGAIGMSVVILSEAIFCPLMLLHLWFWQIAWHHCRQRVVWLCAIAAGCVAGLAILARPSWLLFTPMLFALGMLLGPRRDRHALLFAGMLIGIGFTMSPWWIRNANITGRFVLTTLQVGPSLYDGLHAGATGASDEGMRFMDQFLAEQISADAQASNSPSTLEFRLNRRAQQAALEWAVANPSETALLAFRKFLRTWSLWPNGGEVGSSTLRVGLTLGCFGILALAIVGTLGGTAEIAVQGGSTGCRSWAVGFYWLPCLYFTMLHMIFVGSIRYREPALLVLTIVAGVGTPVLLNKLNHRKTDVVE